MHERLRSTMVAATDVATSHLDVPDELAQAGAHSLDKLCCEVVVIDAIEDDAR